MNNRVKVDQGYVGQVVNPNDGDFHDNVSTLLNK